jgi:sarcosine oxidase subunit gamma
MPDRLDAVSLQRKAPLGGDVDRPSFRLAFRPFLGVAKIQLIASAAEADVTRPLGAELPAPCCGIEAGSLFCAWLAPREWLVMGPEDDLGRFLSQVRNSAAGHGLVTDLTHACAAFELAGPGARDALSAHCPLDLSDHAFPVGSAARSLLSSTDLFIARKADQAHAPAFMLVVDQTMAAYAARMLGEKATAVSAEGNA